MSMLPMPALLASMSFSVLSRWGGFSRGRSRARSEGLRARHFMRWSVAETCVSYAASARPNDRRCRSEARNCFVQGSPWMTAYARRYSMARKASGEPERDPKTLVSLGRSRSTR